MFNVQCKYTEAGGVGHPPGNAERYLHSGSFSFLGGVKKYQVHFAGIVVVGAIIFVVVLANEFHKS